jgi:hypothetical protein
VRFFVCAFRSVFQNCAAPGVHPDLINLAVGLDVERIAQATAAGLLFRLAFDDLAGTGALATSFSPSK